MLVAKCPLRISLAGGSTDLQDFIDINNYGCVISFPATVYTYITVHKNNRNKYIINYTKREEEQDIKKINNDIAREVLLEFNCEPITMTFNTDIHTVGSGLASSSSYLISAIGAISRYKNINLSNFEICKIALKLERKFNPLTGYQDPYGCGIGCFKKIIFKKNENPNIIFLEEKIFENFNMYLKYTGINRQSTNILEKVIKTDRSNILKKVDLLNTSIIQNNINEFLFHIKDAWNEKKISSPFILENEKIKNIDHELENNKKVLAHRLCGAGNGGHFFILTNKNDVLDYNDVIKIEVDKIGLEIKKI